jgi:hypothetical protein
VAEIETRVKDRRDDGSVVVEWDTPARFGAVILGADLSFLDGTSSTKGPCRRGRKWYVDGEADMPAGVVEACRAAARAGGLAEAAPRKVTPRCPVCGRFMGKDGCWEVIGP